MKRHLFSLFILTIAIFAWTILTTDVPETLTASAPEATAQTSQTPILGGSEITLDSAKSWAASRGATEKFINAADYYWDIGEKMGIRADLLYAQAAKETAFGAYSGNVTEDMNNFAGIKTLTATGDTREDHESFATVEEGVQAHFNHMGAYVGVAAVGEPHARLSIVLSQDWAGTIKYAEQLGGKWAPAEDYGVSLVRDYLNTMK